MTPTASDIQSHSKTTDETYGGGGTGCNDEPDFFFIEHHKISVWYDLLITIGEQIFLYRQFWTGPAQHGATLKSLGPWQKNITLDWWYQMFDSSGAGGGERSFPG